MSDLNCLGKKLCSFINFVFLLSLKSELQETACTLNKLLLFFFTEKGVHLFNFSGLTCFVFKECS